MYEDPEWVNEAKTAVKITYVEMVSFEEIVESQSKVSAMLDSIDHRAFFIVDLRRLTAMSPQLISNFPAIARLKLVSHPNLDRVINVVDNSFLESVASIFGRVYRKVYFVRTMEEALRQVSVENITR